VSPAAEAAYRDAGPETHFEAGSWIVEWLRQRDSGQHGPIFALERTANDWRFWMLRADGTVERSANLELCAACHAAAPAAPIFGLPRERQESTPGARRSP
jgi:hypothetical protein